MDELIDRWHAFAAQPKHEIAAQFNDKARSLFVEISEKGLGDTNSGAIQFASADEFAASVLDLRSNEKAWTNQLGNVLLKAQSRVDGGDVTGAQQILRDFCDTCPWHFLSEVANTELQNMDD
jgi:hypothetical protein